jgi:hypothetical protein
MKSLNFGSVEQNLNPNPQTRPTFRTMAAVSGTETGDSVAPAQGSSLPAAQVPPQGQPPQK